MVKSKKSNFQENRNPKGFSPNGARAKKINASTAFDTCSEQLSPFGGLLPLIKFMDLIEFRKIFDFTYAPPTREPKLGHYSMVAGLLMLLFIGFNRIWHFSYIRLDAMLCGFFKLTRLPVASTFWRYVDSLGINQAHALLRLMALLRNRVWQICDLSYYRICLDIDTTVETVFGNQQGARKATTHAIGVKKDTGQSYVSSNKAASICWASSAGAKPSAANKPQRSLLKSKDTSPIALTRC